MSKLLKGKQESRIACILLAVVLIASLIPTYVLYNSRQAYAADTPTIGDTYTGSCYIEDTWRTNSLSYFSVSGFTGELSGSWVVDAYWCASPSAAAPTHVGATYTATVSAINIQEGWVEYYVFITPPDATDGVTRDEEGRLTGYQHVAGYARVAKEFGGYIELYKSSSNKDITDGNACYGLVGATYNVYDANGKHVTTLTTNKEGYSKTAERLPLGWYNVVEVTPPKGYALDESDHWLEITAAQNATATLRLNDNPQNAPLDVLLKKIDRDTELSTPQGAGELKDAKFRINYYSGYYSITDTSWTNEVEPERSWVLESDEQGVIPFNLDGFVSGDAFFYSSKRDITLPLGTVTITEIEAPTGYLINDEVFVRQITSGESVAESVSTYNEPIVKETIKRGDLRLVKEVPTTNDPENQELTRIVLTGIEFEIINDNDQAVVSPDGRMVAPGEVVATIKTDENGLASTQSLTKPSTWAGSLAYGTYIIHEVITSDVAKHYQQEYGITLIAIDDFKMTIASDKQYDIPLIVSNHIPQTPLKVIKKDALTKNTIPLDCAFQIYDGAGDLIIYTDHYNNQVLDTWRTGNDGELILPMKLDEGTYRIIEVEAPDGYVLNSEGIEFSVTEYRTWDNPYTIEYKNAPIRASLAIKKSDASTGTAVEGAEFTLRATTDITTGDGTTYYRAGEIVKAGIVTDASGYVLVEDLYLGLYTLYETKAPPGYALDTNEYTIEIYSQGQDIPVVKMHHDVLNEPTTLRIIKTDLFSGGALPGATYRIWQAGAEEKTTFDTDAIKDCVEGAIISFDSSVEAISINQYDDVLESLSRATPGDSIEFGISAAMREGQEYKSYSLIASFNDDCSITITCNDTELVALNAKVTKDDSAFDMSVLTDEDGIIEVGYLLPGDYLVMETKAPEGYLLPDDLEPKCFTVDDQGMIEGTSLFVIEQTNHRIDISTSARDGASDTKNVIENEMASIIDTVTYENLIPGTKYTVRGTLMDKATGKPLLVNDEEVSATKTFTPDKPNGATEVEFVFDARGLEGTSIVVFEQLFEGEFLVATHEDINDEGQTVEVVKIEIATFAVDKDTASKNMSVKDVATIKDSVVYENLIAGHTYTMRGTLMDKASGKPLLANGKQVTAEKTFIPETSHGTVEIEFTFDATSLAGTDVVVFEKLFDEDGTQVASHEDINDANQTVSLVEDDEETLTKDSPYDKTGDRDRLFAAIAAIALIALAGGSSAYFYQRHSKKSKLLKDTE